jgi:hypothetical protein
MACVNEARKDIVISGVPAIEKFLNRDYMDVLELRPYGIPIKKVGGLPSLNLREFSDWAADCGLAGLETSEITTAKLERDFRKKKILAMEPKPLNSIDEIKNFTGFDNLKIISLVRDFDSCPIKKSGHVYSVADSRDLALWLFEKGIPRSSRPDNSRSFFQTKIRNGLNLL